MRNGLKLLVLSACVLITLGDSSASAQDWAKKMFDHMEYDFGILARGAKAEHRFRMKNGFKEDLQIVSVKSSCGCTDPQLSKRVLKSGEEAELVAVFDTIKFQGQHTATITLTFAPPFSAEVRLLVHGFVRQDVVLQPGRVELGQVPANEGAEQIVNVTYAGRGDWSIEDVRSASDHLEVELRPRIRSAGRVQYEMLVRLKKDAPPGYINDQLTLVTSDQQRRLIPLTVEGNVVPAVSVSPASLHLGVVRRGESVTKQIVVRGTAPFRIVGVDCEKANGQFTFSPGDKERKLHLIPVTFTARETTGKIIEKIQISTHGAGDSALEVVAHVEVLQ